MSEPKPVRITRVLSHFQVMKRLFIAVCIAISILLVGERSVSKAWVEATTITLSPTPASITGSRTVQVQIMVNDVVNLYGADVHISFDPAMLEVVDDLPGSDMIINIQPVNTFLTNLWVVKNEVNNAAGTIWYAVTQLNPATAKSGSGALATIHFKVKKAGTSALSFTSTKLADMQAMEIPATSMNGSVQIQYLFLPLMMK